MVYRKNPLDHEALRQMALARLSERSALPRTQLDLQQAQHLLEELEIHQIELELQNEHLSTARAQLELALNQSNELFDFSPVGNVLTDAVGAITKLNLAGAQLLGAERARLLGSRFGVFVLESQRAQFNDMLTRAQTEHEAQTGDLSLQVSGQNLAHVQVRVLWVDAVAGWQIGLVDVTERRLMEEQLRGSEARLTLALSAVGDGVWDWQVRSGEVMVSKGFADLLAFAQDELNHQVSDLISLVHPADKPQLMRKLQSCIVGKSDRFRIEARMQRRDGRWKWLLVRGAVVHQGAAGLAERFIGTLVDISKNKENEAALATAAQFQQAVFDSISAQIVVLDQAGSIVHTNAAWRRYATKLDCEETVGKPYLTVLADLVAQDQQVSQTVAPGLAAVAADELPYFYASEPILSPRSKRWFTIKITPVHDEAHRMVVTHEDVSVLKRAELASAALANVDSLTGALSRQHFINLAEQELARSQRYALPLVVLMLDLDHFKHVNDSHGHSAGDTVLQSFVQTVTGVLRESDTIGRIGGEEFAVLLPNTTQEGGRVLANRILEEVRVNPVEAGGEHIAYTVSIGAQSLTNQTSFADLLAECDAALYRAKNGGRDRLEVSWESTTEGSH